MSHISKEQMDADIERYNKAKENGTLDKEFPVILSPHTNNKEAKIYELVEKHGLNHSEPDVVALSEAIDWGAEREREEKEEENQEQIEKHQRVLEAIKNKEPLYLSEFGYLISEEDYLNFEDWVASVGKPAGSSSEKFWKVTLSTPQDNKD